MLVAPIRRLRLALWTLALRVRLRRHGFGLRIALGPNLRVTGRPRLDLDPGGEPLGGTLTMAVGANVRVGRDLILDLRPGDHVLEVGDGVILQDHVRVQLRGGAIRLAEHAQVRDHCELKSAGELVVGRRVVLGRSSTLHCVERVELGAYVGLGDRVSITDSDHDHDGSETWFLERPLAVASVVIEDNVLLATNAVILRGVVLRRNSVVAAGAVVVAGDYQAGWLVGGVPARPLKQLGAP